MRLLRHVLPALAFVVAGTWSTQALACDKDKATKTTAAAAISAAYQAELAVKCTPEMAAACKSKKGTKTSASTAAMAEHCASKGAKASAVTAAMEADHCAGKRGAKVSAVTAEMTSDHCAGKGAKASAVVADMAKGVAKAAFVLAGAGASCGTKSAKHARTTAVTAGSACRGNGMTTMAGKAGHDDCDACADMAICHEEIESADVRTQVVPLKNGVMFVYTAESPGRANVVQSAMARRSERLAQIVNSGDKAQLCAECKSLRGAMASGKLHREVVNIEGGALTLMTSSDPSLVAKIHTMVEHHHKSARTKS